MRSRERSYSVPLLNDLGTWLVAAALVCAGGCVGFARNSAHPALGSVATVYIAALGAGPDAALAAETFRGELARRGPLRPVPDSLAADAILSGEILVRRPESPGEDFYPFGAVQLIARVSGDTLWRHRYVERAPLGLVRRGQPPAEHVITMVLQFVDRLGADVGRSAR